MCYECLGLKSCFGKKDGRLFLNFGTVSSASVGIKNSC